MTPWHGFLGEDYLEIRDLTVDFGGFKAIDGVDLNPSRVGCTSSSVRTAPVRPRWSTH